jgi:hypothetical protein
MLAFSSHDRDSYWIVGHTEVGKFGSESSDAP